MEWNRQVVDGLNLALNEATVCGLRYDPSGVAQLLLEVLALPEQGPIDPDPRRVLVLTGAHKIDVILRPDHGQELGPVIPLDSLGALESFFASLTRAETMSGWRFIDVTELRDHWNVRPSLTVAGGPRRSGDHTLHWFADCGRTGPNGSWESSSLLGAVHFAELAVERADATPVSLDEFLADARRWWRAFRTNDPRLSVDAQRQARSTSLRWRSWR